MGGLCMLIFVGLVIAAIVLALNHGKYARVKDAFVRIAARYHGRCESPGWWFSFPSVRFVHRSAAVILDVHSAGGEHKTYFTQLRFYWPDPKMRMEIYPERTWSRVGKLMGMEDVEIGSPEFDEDYIIKGSEHGRLRTLINANVQWQIERLRRLLGNGEIYVSIGGGVMLIKKRSLVRSYGPLLELTEAALALYDEAMLTLEDGIEFVETAVLVEVESSGQTTTTAMCQICGDEISIEVVYCRRCKTPHHRDCWHYYGACSTYGCQETQYSQAKAEKSKRVRK